MSKKNNIATKKQNSFLQYLTEQPVNEMPMLGHIMCNFSTIQQSLFSEKVGISVHVTNEQPISIVAKKHLSSIENNTICAELRFSNWDGVFFATIPRALIYQFIDLTLGGNNFGNIVIEVREFTAIEKNLITDFFNIVLEGLKKALTVIRDDIWITISDIHYNTLGCSSIRSETIIFIKNPISFSSNKIHSIDFLIPIKTLLPVKSQLMKSFSNAILKHNGAWEDHMLEKMMQSSVKFAVELDMPGMTINAIKDMKVGDTIVTQKQANNPINITVNGASIYKGKLGKVDKSIAIEITN